MREVRKPAQRAEALGGRSTLSSVESVKNGEIIHQSDVSQPPLSPNYCNHVPFAPKLFVIPSNHKPRAKIVQETDKRLAAAYTKPKGSLRSLQFHDESGHRVKSQRREAAIALLQVMNYYQDDSTGRIGRLQDNGGFRDLTLKKLAQYAGLKLRRAIRAMKDIVRSGYLKVIKQFIRNPDTGEVKGLPSIRSFLPKFFTDLDVAGSLWTKWFTQRGWANERAAKKISKQDRKKSRAMLGLLKETIGNLGTTAKTGARKIMGIVSSVTPVESEKKRNERIEHDRKLNKKALELFNLDSSKSPSEYLRALREAHPFK